MKFKKLAGLLLVVSAVTFILGACGKQTSQEKKEGLKVVTTFYPMYDFTRNVVGDDANISMLIDANTEPHDYEPSAKDIAKIQDADVFVYNSDEMETWVKAVLKNIDTKKVKVIEASHGIDLLDGAEEHEDHDHEGEEDHDHDGHSHAHDPHVWLDPVLAQQEVKTIRDGLIEKDEANKEKYQKNADSYLDKLEKLDHAFETGLKDAKNRSFVTQHTAFAYLSKRYNLTQKAIAGLSPDQEPTPAELARIEDYVKENQVKVIFTEDLASTKIAETISSATGASLEVLSPIEGISEKDQKAGLDYIGVMEKNLQALQLVIK